MWILCAGSFINRFGSFVAVFLVLYLREKGYSIAEAGFVVSLYGVGNVAAATVGGLLADRLGRRNTIALSMLSSAATLVALSQADDIVLIGALTLLAGLTGEWFRPASSALLTDLVPAGKRLPAFALNRLAVNLGLALGPATAGLLADRSFTYLFVADALTSAVFGVLTLAALPEGVRTRRAEERHGEGIRTIVRDRPFLFFLASSVVGSFVYFQATATFPLHVKESGLSNADYGLLISLNGLAIVLLELPSTSITQRFRAVPTLAVGSLLVGLGFALNAWAATLPALAFTVVIWTLGRDHLCAGRGDLRRGHRAGRAPRPLPGRKESDPRPRLHARPGDRRRALRLERRRLLARLRAARSPFGGTGASRIRGAGRRGAEDPCSARRRTVASSSHRTPSSNRRGRRGFRRLAPCGESPSMTSGSSRRTAPMATDPLSRVTTP